MNSDSDDHGDLCKPMIMAICPGNLPRKMNPAANRQKKRSRSEVMMEECKANSEPLFLYSFTCARKKPSFVRLEGCAKTKPSFEKATNLPRMMNPAANPHDNAQNSFIVRSTTSSSQENLDDNKLEIQQEEAVCICCSTLLKEEEVFQMKCQCKIPLGLVHDACKLKWSEENGKYNCPGCGTEPETVPAQLVKVTDSATLEEKKRKKMNIFSRFKRM